MGRLVCGKGGNLKDRRKTSKHKRETTTDELLCLHELSSTSGQSWVVTHQVTVGTSGQEKIIVFLGAQPGDKNFLQTNGVFLCYIYICISI